MYLRHHHIGNLTNNERIAIVVGAVELFLGRLEYTYGTREEFDRARNVLVHLRLEPTCTSSDGTYTFVNRRRLRNVIRPLREFETDTDTNGVTKELLAVCWEGPDNTRCARLVTYLSVYHPGSSLDLVLGWLCSSDADPRRHRLAESYLNTERVGTIAEALCEANDTVERVDIR